MGIFENSNWIFLVLIPIISAVVIYGIKEQNGFLRAALGRSGRSGR